LAREIDAILAARGLTGLVLDTPRARYEYTGGPAQTTLEVLAGDGNADEVLRAAMERGINAQFAASGRSDPFRFCAVDATARCYVGVAYDHVVAGGDSIVELLAEIVRRYTLVEAASAARDAVPSLYPKTCGGMLVRHVGYVLAGMTAVPGALASARRSLAPRYPAGGSRQNAFATMRIPKAGVEALARARRTWGVTRADLMIALLMKAIAPLAGDARHGKRRREIGIAWIVNIRRDFGTTLKESFGQFLSSYRCSHPVPGDISLRDLSQDVHWVTSKVRKRKLYLVTLLPLAALWLLWPRLSAKQRGAVDAKNYPAWAGLTPLDVDALWPQAGAAPVPDEYLRAVSTGPASPLILAAPTAGGEWHLGFSYRVAAYTAEDIARIAAAVTHLADSLDA